MKTRLLCVTFCAMMASLVLLATSTTVLAGVIRVKWNSPYNGPGNDWDHAYHTINAGITAAVSGDDVWVAQGTYVENVSLKDGVGVYGGFVGTETTREERDRKLNVTVIDGNHLGSVVQASGSMSVAPVIDGFTIQNGSTGLTGGGVYCLSNKCTITNNIITQNRAQHGGGIGCEYTSATISGNLIIGNVAWGSGGGIYCYQNSWPKIYNNVILGNSAQNGGGGINCNYTTNTSYYATISNNTIVGNGSGKNGDGIGNGEGIFCYRFNATISNNTVAFNPAGIYASSCTLTLRNNDVYNLDGPNYTGVSAGVGDISVDPKIALWQFGGYHIQPDSPCRDTGYSGAPSIGTTDIDGQDRIQPSGGTIDIGADESDSTLWPVTPAVIRVDGVSGNDLNDGSTWELAKKTIQGAINTAATNGAEVWVKGGTYYERIILKPFVALYGGFAGNELTREARNWTLNETTINASLLDTAVKIIGAGHRVQVIDGFTIRYGKAADYGGGIFCQLSNVTISNNTIKDNQAVFGAGFWIEYCAPLVTTNTISANTATADGAGIYSSTSSPLILNNTISSNYATQNGGGLFLYSGYSTVSGNTISSNSARSGGGIAGGELISNNIISGNTARSSTGGGGGISGGKTICNNIIVGNRATWPSTGTGGGISATTLTQTVYGNIIAGNTSGGDGAGICCSSAAAPAITNNTILENTTTANGGGICFASSAGPKASNNIVAFNSSGMYKSSGTPTLRNNDVYNPAGYNYSGLSAGTGDISLDPLFVNRAGGDYHITALSPCIDTGYSSATGIGSYDMDWQARLNGIVDIGADEFWPGTITDAKLLKDGMSLDIDGLIVSAAFTDYFYAESDNRVCGIRVNKTAHPLQAGMRAHVLGALSTNSDGERCIEATDAHRCSPPNDSGAVDPLGLPGRSLGGGDWRYVEATGAGQKGIADASGLNNIGLLVKTWGAVTQVDTGDPATWFVIDDGSEVGAKVVVPSDVTIDPLWQFANVVGISSCEKVDTELYRLLRVRRQEDIAAF